MLTQALAYLERGKSIIPLKPRSKVPAIPWAEFQTRKPTVEEVTRWFTDMPDANIGLVTGAVSNVVVIDLDGPEGLAEAAKLGLQSNVACNTGRGRHLYYKHPGTPVGNAVRLAPGIDIRGDGGYVVAPPSVHENGTVYTWEITPGPLSVYSGAEKYTQDIPLVVDTNQPGWIAEEISKMGPGYRDEPLFRICSRLRHDGLAAEDARALLLPMAQSVGADYLLDEKIQNVWSAYTPAEKRGPLKTVSIGELLKSELTTQWVVEGYIPTPGITFIYGGTGSGKTWLTLDLALALSEEGGKWLGCGKPLEKTKVLYLDDESSHNLLSSRLKLMMKGRNVDLDNVMFSVKQQLDLNKEEDLALIEQALTAFGAKVIVVDSFSCFHSGNDNDTEHIRNTMQRLKDLVKKYGVALVIVDHISSTANYRDDGVENAYDMQGSKVKARQANSLLCYRAKGDHCVLTPTKMRDSEVRPPVKIRLVEDDGGVKLMSDEVVISESEGF